jgi:hypothetical protein
MQNVSRHVPRVQLVQLQSGRKFLEVVAFTLGIRVRKRSKAWRLAPNIFGEPFVRVGCRLNDTYSTGHRAVDDVFDLSDEIPDKGKEFCGWIVADTRWEAIKFVQSDFKLFLQLI